MWWFLKKKKLLKYNIISIKDFYNVSLKDRVKINKSIEENFLICCANGYDFTQVYNFPLYKDDTLFFSKLYKNFKKLSYRFFGNFHIAPQNQTRCLCYRSNKDWSRINWHNHLYTSTINGVYYYQVEGDGITFEHKGEEFHYIPEQGELIIFPNNLYHKPDIATSDTWRYSINMELITTESCLELYSTLFKKYGFS